MMTARRKHQRKQKKQRQAKTAVKSPKAKRQNISVDELHAIIERAKSALSAEDQEKLLSAVDTLAYLTQELETKGTSIRRLRKMLFGSSSEKTRDVVSGVTQDAAEADAEEADAEEDSAESSPNAEAHQAKTSSESQSNNSPKDKGHGRNPASAYKGAQRVSVSNASLKAKSECPDCHRGKVYPMTPPAQLVRVTGVAPLAATVYELERLRCNLCGKVFTAQPPPGVTTEKYDDTAAALIALLRYGVGLPWNRIERLEKGFGIPLPTSTQWEVVEEAACKLAPVFTEYIHQAAQGDVLYNDDTTMKILELTDRKRWEELDEDGEFEDRTGVFTSGVVSTIANRQIALFFTGQKHAGENIADVLAKRSAELPPPIQMCDGLDHNIPKNVSVFLARCNAHARRKFVDVANNFPDEVLHALEVWGKVYKLDAVAKEENMTPDERLAWHQKESQPLMDKLKEWAEKLLDECKVEPNSGLGEAIKYMLNHWEPLTLFLTKSGAPIDNNLCERVLKKAILHRKNSLFYRTLNGAYVGDMFMSLIHTAELNKIEPFDYLVALQRHHKTAEAEPSAWMPWNYKTALARLS